MTQQIVTFFNEHISSTALVVIFIAMIPIIELRGAIPIGVALGLNPFVSFAYALIGSTLMAPILLLLLKPILALMKKWKPFRALAFAVEDLFKGKAEKLVKNENTLLLEKRKKMLGIYTFVAIPIPMTGVWTGSAIAVFIELNFSRAVSMVALGNITAGLIVTVLSILIGDKLDLVLDIFLIIALIVLLIFIVKLVFKMIKNKKNKAIDNNMKENEIVDKKNK